MDKKNIEDISALTPMQEGMLFHYLKEPGSDQYFEQLCLEISGKLDIEIFRKAWNFVIETNEMLRAVFRWETVGHPVQIIVKKHELQLIFHDFSGINPSEAKKHLEKVKAKDKKEKFDLRQVPLRVILCKIQDTKYQMIISNHHILYDGWSNGVILREFFNAYNELSNKNRLTKPVKTKFKEFVKCLQEEDTKKQEKFWRNYLKGYEAQAELSLKKRTGKRIGSTGEYRVRFQEDIKDKLEDFVKTHKRNLASLLYSAWGLLLQKYNNSNDVIFGTTVSGRSAKIPEIEDIIGLFINTLPLRVQSYPGETVKDLLVRIDNALQLRGAYEFSSLVNIKEWSELDNKDELFDYIIVIENYPLNIDWSIKSSRLPLSIDSYSMVENTPYDLVMSVMLFDRFELILSFDKKVFNVEDINRLSCHFIGIVEDILENPGKVISQIEIISEEEKRQILYDFNDTDVEFLRGKTIHELFAEQEERTPERIAVVGSGQSTVGKREETGELGQITYTKLDEQSNQLAHLLRQNSVNSDTIVGIMVKRSIEMVIGILGILKAGGTYLPIEPDYPEERINYMLIDAKVKFLVNKDNNFREFLLGEDIDAISIDDISLYSSAPEAFNACPKGSPSHLHLPPAPETCLAYVIYTSGSTGKPKGVMVEHRSAVNTLVCRKEEYRMGADVTSLQLFSFAFDGFVTAFFTPLFSGSRTILPRENEAKDIHRIIDIIHRHLVTHFIIVPAFFHAFIENLSPGDAASLRVVTLAGDKCAAKLVELTKKKNRNIEIAQEYGVTEAAVMSTLYRHQERDSRITIGHPTWNTYIYIVDRNDCLQPIGIPGELCIAGAGVARGYLNNPQLTSEKFTNYKQCTCPPQYSIIPLPHSPIYRTGDLAQWFGDGNIKFLGRIDHQVKIRGFRIEPGEIERQLLSHEAIKEVVVMACEDRPGEKYLCAYVTTPGAEQTPPGNTELREFLSQMLPQYMIPSIFIPIEKIPLTPNGKINRNALPGPEAKVGGDFVKPRNEKEKILAEIWSELLEIEKEKIAIDANFFELGGHSLKMTRLISKIHKELDVNVQLSKIFEMPTIEVLAAYIDSAAEDKFLSIEPVEEKDYCHLSPGQKRLYFLQQTDLGSTVYNMPGIMLLEGELKKRKFEGTFRRLIERHESFRTSFQLIDGEAVQRIHDEVDFEIEYNRAERKAQNAERKKARHAPCAVHCANTIKNFIRPFDLSHAPLLRIGLIKIEEKKHIFIVDMHHIIFDGTSLNVLVKDFMSLYAGADLPPIKFQYKDFSEWEKSKRVKETRKQQEGYWLKEFDGEISTLDLPTDFARPMVRDFGGSTLGFEIEKKETNYLKELALEEDATLYIVLLSVFNVLLLKLSGQEQGEIIIGSPTAGRRHPDLEQIVGMFVNTIVFKNYPSGQKTFREFLKEVRDRALKAFENQDYPFEDLVDKLALNRNPGRNPIFDVMFVLQNMDILKIEIPGLALVHYVYENDISKFDLTLQAMEAGENLLFTFEYCTKLFKRETIERFINYFKKMVSLVIDDAEKKILEIEIISEEEKRQLLFDFNNTDADYPRGTMIHQLFAVQVERTPDRVALTGMINPKSEIRSSKHKAPFGQINAFGVMHLSYSELNKKSTRLAYLLHEKGVKPDTVVGFMVEPSLEMIIGMFAVVKAGGAYLPIDSDYPADRIQFMLADSRANLLVTTSTLAEKGEKVRGVEGEKIFLDVNRLACSAAQEAATAFFNPQPATSSSNLAYIIYTSGTTGKPKGVLIEHKNVVRLLFNTKFQFDFNHRDVWTLFHSYSFDFSVWEMYGALLYGGRLVVIPRMVARDPWEFLGVLRAHKVTILNQTPSAFYNLMHTELNQNHRDLKLRYVIFGGEALQVGKLKEWKKKYPNTKLVNMFGITETTVHVTYQEIVEEEIEAGISLIGKPIPTLTTYIMDSHQRLVPTGTPGEIWVGGEGVARGYLNRPELSSERFPENPFKPGERMYKSGDLARLSAKGQMEYLGRIDQQVQIRGFRIELEEIESQLLKHEHIKEAVVIAREGQEPGEKYLCAYIVSWDTEAQVSKRDLNSTELKEYLSHILPGYMIPLFFVFVEGIPMTSHGKVDREALPGPVFPKSPSHVAPGNSIEKRLAEIWLDVLGRERESLIGVDDNFFELGGHSLRATYLISKIHDEFNISVPLNEVFKKPTIRGLAEFIKNSGSEEAGYAPIVPLEEKEHYNLSSAQKRLYLIQQMDLEGIGYNMPVVMLLEGELQKEKFEDIFKKLIERHESLRTSFRMVENEPVQRTHYEVEFEIEYYLAAEDTEHCRAGSLSGNPATCNLQLVTSAIKNFVRPFDLSQAPLLRVGLIELSHTPAALRGHPSPASPNIHQREGSGSRYLLMVDMHHIISDAVSINIFKKEFMDLYDGRELPILRIQYKDFSEWQNSKIKGESIKQQEEYWLRALAGEVPVLNLPTDFPRPAVQDFAGRSLEFEIGEEETKKLKHLALTGGATLYMVLLGLFNIFLDRISGQEEIVVGSPSAGRIHGDLEQTIGFFVNTFALKNYPAREKPINVFLQEVRDNTLKAQENQDYPFEKLVEKVSMNIERDASRNPLFDVMFTLQNMPIREIDITGLKLIPYKNENPVAKFDLTFICEDWQGNLHFTVEYRTKLFKQDTIHRFTSYFKNIVSFVSDAPARRIEEIEIISEEEKRQILYDFNDTVTGYPQDKTIPGLFAEQAGKTPDQLALIGQIPKGVAPPAYKKSQIPNKEGTRGLAPLSVHITYNELNQRSDQLAYLLKEKGVQLDTIVGIMAERSLDVIIGILGILKIGAAYLPIDPDYPKKRINFMLKDSNARFLLKCSSAGARKIETNPDYQNDLNTLIVLNFEHFHFEFVSDFGFRISDLNSSNPAYVIYTSGSSGRPKGVLIEHHSVINLSFCQKRYFNITRSDRILQFSSLCFDASVEQIFITFFSGAVLVLIEKDILLDIKRFERFISLHSIAHIHAVPSFLNNTSIPGGIQLKRIISGGDVCPISLVKKLSKMASCAFYNEYGPTETTVTSVEMLLESADEELAHVPIGKPIDNTTIYLFDKWLNLVPMGLVGEMYIGGEGLARGYLNNPELTAEKFIEKVTGAGARCRWENNEKLLRGVQGGGFLEKSPPGRRRQTIYKTGDLAHWLPDGNIKFLGRTDNQVKIRGYRIELVEIEKSLLLHEHIKEVVVIADEGQETGEKYLCAYIVRAELFTKESQEPLKSAELKEYLSNILPGYMIPSFFVFLEGIPLNSHGKVDRRALPGFEFPEGRPHVAPRDSIEKRLAEIWLEVLGRGTLRGTAVQPGLKQSLIGIDDNFFELGGHSLKANQLSAAIHQKLKVKIPLREIFQSPVIRKLAEYVREAAETGYVSILPGEEKEYYTLSSAQKRFYVLWHSDPGNTVYNVPQVIPLDIEINKVRLEQIFKRLIERHESLRTSFVVVENKAVQKIHASEEMKFSVEVYDLESGSSGQSSVIEHFVRCFDLSQAPLVRVGVIEAEKQKPLLMVDMHHIITDGLSGNVLIKDFLSFYRGEELPPLKLQYKDFSQWQRGLLQPGEIKKQEEYWLNIFKENIPVLNLSTDYERLALQCFEGNSLNFEINTEEVKALKQYACEEHVTLYMIFLSIYNIFLSKLSNQEDIVVGIGTAGRNHVDLEPIIGAFVNTLALRNHLQGEKTFETTLKEVKNSLLEAFENQDYPLENLVEKIVGNRDTTRNPLFDVGFAFDHLEDQFNQYIREIGTCEIGELLYNNYDKNISRFDMVLYGYEARDRVFFSIEYSAKLFKKETIERFIGYFEEIISTVVKNKGVKLEDIRLSHDLSVPKLKMLEEEQGDFGFEV